MRSIVVSAFLCLLIVLDVHAQNRNPARSATFPFVVYNEYKSPDNHFEPSGWMGDINNIRFSDEWTQNPYSGRTCIQIRYAGRGAYDKDRWAGIYWHYDWDGSRGFDFRGATKLQFYARGERGGETVEFKAGGHGGKNPDSDGPFTTFPIRLTDRWARYEIVFPPNAELRYISGGFAWVASRDYNESSIAIYLDEIAYLR